MQICVEGQGSIKYNPIFAESKQLFMTQHPYCIARHTFTLYAPAGMNPKELLPSFTPFAREACTEQPLFVCRLADALPYLAQSTKLTRFEWEGAECIIYTAPTGYEVAIMPEHTGRTWRMQTDRTFANAAMEYTANHPQQSFVMQNFLMMLFAFASAPHGTLMFHASVIRRDGKGYLFLGKSGTGKSTHSRLWLQHLAGSELLNDDNPIVRRHADGRIIVYGSPWSGKTPCYRNEEAPLGAFVRLQQAPHNKIVREGASKAFAALLPSCSCLKQDEAQYNHICDTITALATGVPVYKLECLPNREAAELCYQTISGHE